MEPPSQIRRRSRRRTAARMLGGFVVFVLLLGSLLSMPFTLGRTPGLGAAATQSRMSWPRRCEATNPDLGLLPPFWAPHGEDEDERVDGYFQQTGLNARPVLGTDRLGRDVFLRCLAGGGISLSIGFCAAALAVVIGTVYGTIAATAGGRVDALMMRAVDVLYGLPYILLVVLLAVAVDGVIERVAAHVASAEQAPAWLVFVQERRQVLNVVTLLVAIGAVSWLTMARVIRGQVLSLKQQPFMEACRAVGVPLRRQFWRHLLPNLLGPITVYATLTVPQAILSESFLSFLGIGVKEPLPSWGNLAAAGLSELNTVRVRWWLLFWPCLFIGLTLLGLNFIGEALRERLDPRRRHAGAAS